MSKIITAPAPVLGQIVKPFDFKKDDLSSLLKNMEKALLSASDPKGVGLAAPQIGRETSVFITKPDEKSKISVFINPKILASSNQQLATGKKETSHQKLAARSQKPRKLEGCLSLPTIWGEVKRSPVVTLKFQTINGKEQTKKFSGFMATIVQHEVDHLYGILFPRRVLEQKGKLYKSSKNEKGEDEFEEITI